MIAGAESIDDMALLRHGAMGGLFTDVRAPSTLGTFLQTLSFGHVRQLDAVASRLLIGLSKQAPLLPGADKLAYIDIDIDGTVKPTYGYAKEGAGRGYCGVKGLNALLGTGRPPGSAPLITGARLRKGQSNSAKGAHRFVSDTLVTAKAAGATGVLIARMDSAYDQCDVVASVLRHRAHSSITARLLPPVRTAIDAIPDDAWTPIEYTNANYDQNAQAWISEAKVAEVAFTAFTSKANKRQATARLIVWRVPDVNGEQPELAVHRLPPPPRGVHQLTPADAGRRVGPPRPRDRGAGHRRPEQRAARAPAVGEVLGQQCLAGLHCDGLQPHPHRRRSRLDVPREGDHRHDPRAAHQRPRPDRPFRPQADPAPTDRLALAEPLGTAPRRSSTPRRGLNPSTTAHGLTERPEDAGPAGYAGTPRLASTHSAITSGSRKPLTGPGRWIPGLSRTDLTDLRKPNPMCADATPRRLSITKPEASGALPIARSS